MPRAADGVLLRTVQTELTDQLRELALVFNDAAGRKVDQRLQLALDAGVDESHEHDADDQKADGKDAADRQKRVADEPFVLPTDHAFSPASL